MRLTPKPNYLSDEESQQAAEKRENVVVSRAESTFTLEQPQKDALHLSLLAFSFSPVKNSVPSAAREQTHTHRSREGLFG
jgi:hypothetical protein